MDRFEIEGGRRLSGSVVAGGSKNSSLPCLFATLLSEKESVVRRVPNLQDITSTVSLLQSLGCDVSRDLERGEVRSKLVSLKTDEAPYDLVRKMRASVLVLGPLLARFGRARVSMPGGCAIGARPVDFHLAGLKQMGAQITIQEGFIEARCQKLQGARIGLEFPSVGATENLMMAATLASGETLLENCAQEPEIVCLANALRSMGAVIEGAGTPVIRVQGAASGSLGGIEHAVVGDRIEAGTFLAAGFATGGDVEVKGIHPEMLEAVLLVFEAAGAKVHRGTVSAGDGVRVQAQGRSRAVHFRTLPFPGFPTDMQAQLMAVLTLASGTSVIEETVFENRFMHVPELTRMGAQVVIKGNAALVEGVGELRAAPVMATDLRASAGLVIAALAAHGTSVINRIYHLDRGYECMEEKLRALGADVKRVSA